LIHIALRQAGAQRVREVRLGLKYTVVMLEDGSCGLAYTPREEAAECGIGGQYPGTLKGRSVKELIPGFVSGNPVEVSLGLAAINAVVNSREPRPTSGDLLEVLSLTPEDSIAVVGDFTPLVDNLRRHFDRVFVFEKKALRPEIYTPCGKMAEVLPSCSVVIVTATTLINKSFEEVMALVGKPRATCLLGPSTPMCPEFFKATKVNLLSGIAVTGAERLLQLVSEGGGPPHFKDCVAKVNLWL